MALSGCVSVALWGNMGPGTDQLQALTPVSNSTKPLMDRYGLKISASRYFSYNFQLNFKELLIYGLLLHDEVWTVWYVLRALEMLKGRGQRSWSVGLSIADIIHSIVMDKKKIHSVTTLAEVSYLPYRICIQ